VGGTTDVFRAREHGGQDGSFVVQG
jgi:hypothetical protein